MTKNIDMDRFVHVPRSLFAELYVKLHIYWITAVVDDDFPRVQHELSRVLARIDDLVKMATGGHRHLLGLKAYRVNNEVIYAALTWEEAIRLAIDDCGCPRDYFYD